VLGTASGSVATAASWAFSWSCTFFFYLMYFFHFNEVIDHNLLASGSYHSFQVPLLAAEAEPVIENTYQITSSSGVYTQRPDKSTDTLL
jgi:hypothetical protein